MKIFEILTALNSTSKKKEKISIIRANRGNFEFVSVLKYAYDKLDTNYFVKKVPIGDVSGIADIDDNMDVVCTLLNSLSTRKVTGNDALLAIKNVLDMLNTEGQDVLTRIIKRDLKCGFSENSINEAIPNLIPTFDVALAQSYKDHEKNVWNGTRWFGSRKLDGLRCIAKKANGEFTFYSRQGKQFLTMNNLIPDLKLLTEGISDIVLDGEICIINNGKEDFKAISKEYNIKNHTIEHPMYKMFDILNVEEFNSQTSTRIFSERYKQLKGLFAKVSNSKTIDVLEQILITKESFEHLADQVAKYGWEGSILRKDTIYIGKRSNDILKVKKFEDIEAVVDSIETGEYTYTEKGKGQVTEDMMLRVNVTIDGKLVKGKHKVGVGSGWSIEQRKAYMKNPKLIVGKEITLQFFERTLNEQGGESLRFPTVKYVYENGRKA